MLLKKQMLFKHKDLMSSGWEKQWKSTALSQFYFPPDIFVLNFIFFFLIYRFHTGSQSNRSWGFPADRRRVGWQSHYYILHVGRLCGRCLQVWTMLFQQSGGGGWGGGGLGCWPIRSSPSTPTSAHSFKFAGLFYRLCANSCTLAYHATMKKRV